MNSQCTAIAAYAIATLCSKPPPYTRDILDEILEEGDKYYHDVRRDAGFLTPDELSAPIQVQKRRISLIVDICGGGLFDEKVDGNLRIVIKNSLDTYVDHKGNCGFMFVGHSKSVSFVPLPDTKFLFFNSHCVDSNNRVFFCYCKGCS